MTYKRWLYIAILLFGAGFGAGLVLALVTPASIPGLLSDEMAALKELSSLFTPFSALTAVFIFIKNVFTLLISFTFSPILCLAPILTLLLNGLILAFVSGAVIQEQSLGFLLAGILPHGIIELPAFILGEAAALSFGAAVMLALLKKERVDLLLPSLKRNLIYLAIACALLLPAAIIETYITPLLIT